ncbi:MAG: sigma-54-dependent Fis family transcriptional regulator [Acidobacteriaceae bacterium]|nr:sigma-54-dependent Fis family transcriptional regulator [Acidobacteriaceae bacterium]MBV9779438.1 sigma-54-dependent Fis family transcriptional regulator [Acidobacteriaceae bacterium]
MTPQIALDVSPLSTLVGNSPAMKQVHRLVSRMGKSRFPVLILGETGTGKEIVARAIHNMEGRGPFVVVDCSSLVGQLMESELFGYAKGAFTGAVNQKLGLLDAANGGTAFFDEIGELPLELQMKLLRVLQEKEFRAVGGLTQRSSNFRVIAATNRDLLGEVEAKRFRQDLYYRLNVMRLRLTPLRERKDDIPPLIAHFLQRYGNDHKVTDEVMDSLIAYDWPGNVRELEHTVQRMVAMNSGPWITVAELPSTVMNRSFERQIENRHSGSSGMSSSSAPKGIMPLAEIEKKAILDALDYTKGDRTVAAAMLGIGRTTLYRKLKEYGL